MKRLDFSGQLVVALAAIALIVSVWQAALGDWQRAGCWCLIVVYWVVLTIKNIVDFWEL